MEGKKSGTSIKKVPSMKSESETQTAVAVRVPSFKTKAANEAATAAEKIVTPDQIQSASMARKRRMITKKAQGVRTREKTPEPSRSSVPHEDTTTTDEEDSRAPKTSVELEADDIYEEMRRKIQQKVAEKDHDDIDIHAIREAKVEEAKERRRRSISPFAILTKEELASLQRKGSFVDPGNKLLSTIPSYPITFKDEFDPIIRKNSIISDTDIKDFFPVPPSPTSPVQQKGSFQLKTPPSGKKRSDPVSQTEKPKVLSQSFKTVTNQAKSPKSVTNQQAPLTAMQPTKSNLKTSTNVDAAKLKNIDSPQNYPTPNEAPPIRPKRSKSGTRSQGRTSESEMSEDQSKPKVETLPQKTPKPKERRRTIAAIKRSVRERSPAVRSKSASRPEKPLDTEGIEMTQTSSAIIELLQKARRRSLSIPNDDLKTSTSNQTSINSGHQLMTPKKNPSTPKRLSCPKTIQILSAEETMESFKKAQRKSVEMERSRRSSGYVDASQSEVTSSCYSSSYSEDESDFDLSKKSAELAKKLSLLHLEKENERKKEEKVEKIEKIEEKIEKPVEVEKTLEELELENKMSLMKFMFRNSRKVWKEVKLEHKKDYEKMRMLGNRCFSDLMILIILCGFGGVIFRYTEGAFENFYKCGVKRVKRDFIDSLWQTSHNMREEDWKSNARKKLWDFETQLHAAHEAGVHSYSGQKSWSFMNSVVYCLTVVTTIGYGHIAPSTTTGRALTIVYAIIGIPLFLILLADFGKLFTRCIKFVWAFVRRLYYTGSCRKVRRTVQVQEVMKGLNMVYTAASTFRRPSQYGTDEEVGQMADGAPQRPPKPNQNLLTVPDPSQKPNQEQNQDAVDQLEQDPQTPAPSVFEIDDEFNLPISVAITCWTIYIFMGASIYVVWEEWSFFESFYFVFISMSTIGFGDFVPNHPIYMMGSIVYLVFGMALTSMCINVVQEKLSDSFRQASAKIGATMGLRVSDEDGSLAPITPPPVEIPAVHGTSKNDTPEIV